MKYKILSQLDLLYYGKNLKTFKASQNHDFSFVRGLFSIKTPLCTFAPTVCDCMFSSNVSFEFCSRRVPMVKYIFFFSLKNVGDVFH